MATARFGEKTRKDAVKFFEQGPPGDWEPSHFDEEALKIENRRLTEQVEMLRQKTEQMKKFVSLGKMAGMLAHEIVNPLDGIIRNVSLASHHTHDQAMLAHYLNSSEEGLKRISHVVRSVLDYSWGLAQHDSLCDMNRVVENSLDSFDKRFEFLRIEVRKNLARDLPWIKLCGAEFIVNNLVKNACDAMPEGGVLTIATQRLDDGMMMSVSDTGPGILPEYREKIFEPFFTTKTKGKGTGLGLAIVREIVDQARGHIAVQNNEGGGASFIINISAVQIFL